MVWRHRSVTPQPAAVVNGNTWTRIKGRLLPDSLLYQTKQWRLDKERRFTHTTTLHLADCWTRGICNFQIHFAILRNIARCPFIAGTFWWQDNWNVSCRKVCNGLWLEVGVGCNSGCQGRLVSIMTVLLTEQSVNLGSIPSRYRDLSPYHSFQIGCGQIEIQFNG